MKTIKTDRLILRKFNENDAESMFKNWAYDELVARYVTWTPHKNLEHTRYVINKWIDRYNKKNFYNWNWAITESDKNDVIGAVSTLNYEEKFGVKQIEVGFCLSSKHWNKGYITEALRAIVGYYIFVLGFNRIYAKHDTEHVASKRVLEKSGFTFEGVLRQAGGSNSNPVCDLAVYSIIRDDLERCQNSDCEGL